MRRNIQELRDVHKDEDMWIICGGASMNYINPSFFMNKLTMGVNEVFTKYKYCKYYMRKDSFGWDGKDVLEHIVNISPTSKLIVSDYKGCALEWGKNDIEEITCMLKKSPEEWVKERGKDVQYYIELFKNIEKYKDLDYWYFEHVCGHGELDEESLTMDFNKFANGLGIMGIAVQIAVFFGCKNIIVCGADGVYVDGKFYFDEYSSYANSLTGDEKEVQKSVLEQKCVQETHMIDYYRSQGINIHGLNAFVNLRFEGHGIKK